MSTLLLRFKAPMQSWGISAKFDSRSTERFPSKSAVIGMIAGAFGRKRNESVDDLKVLRFGVRVDEEGILLRDFQTAKNPNIKTSVYGKPGVYRDYLADAAFLVGLEGENAMLESVKYALEHPVFPLFLGRRSCPPEGRVVLNIVDNPLKQALLEAPLLSKQKNNDLSFNTDLRFILEAKSDDEESYILRDNPISFDQNCRQFGFRRVIDTLESTAIPGARPCGSRAPETDHDPFAALLEED